MIELIPLILRNVTRNRRRSLLTLTSTAISLSLLAILFAVYQGYFHGDDASPSEALRLVARHRVSLTQALPASHYEKIKAMPGVAEVCAWSWFQGTYIDEKNFFARFAVDADKVFDVHLDWKMAPEAIKDFKRERTACVVAEKISKDYKIKVGDNVTIVGDIYPVTLELKCVGIFSAPAQSECLIFHKEYLTELLPKNSPMRDTVGTYLILAKTTDDVPIIERDLDDALKNDPYPTHTESEKEFARSFLAFLGNIKLYLLATCAAVTFTIMLVSANTVAMAVRERTREMAILRTLGFRPGEIMQMVIGESMLISLIGGVIGIVMGWGLSQAVASSAATLGIQSLKWEGALLVLGVAMVVGLIASLVPSIIASRKNVVESLRFTG